MKRPCRIVLALCVTAALACSSACVRKSISVRSDPPGAIVYLDGTEIGRTPVNEIPFDFYGVREITVQKYGYLCEKRIVDVDEPWYSCFPLDIFSELIIPWNIPDHRYYYFGLKRMEQIESVALVRHAQETREIARARIDGARNAASYRPRAYVVKGAEKRFFLLAPFTSPSRTEPVYQGEPDKKVEAPK